MAKVAETKEVDFLILIYLFPKLIFEELSTLQNFKYIKFGFVPCI